MRIRLLVLLVGTSFAAGTAHASKYVPVSQVVRRAVLQTKATVFSKTLRAVGYSEVFAARFGIHFSAKPTAPKRVSDELWRGTHQDDAGLANLKSRNFSRVIGFTKEANYDKDAPSMGLASTQIPFVDNTTPTMQQVKEFLGIIKSTREARAQAQARGEEGPGPIYVHCDEGVGRTGIMVAAYRMKYYGWSSAEAVAEAREFGLKDRTQILFIRELGKVIDTL